MRFRDDKEVSKIVLEAIQCVKETPSLTEIFEALLLDESLYSHSVGVAKIVVQLGIRTGNKRKTLLTLAVGGLLHDVGKLKISKEILYKTSELTAEEIAVIREHPVLGYELLKDKGVSDAVLELVKYHHEMPDGSGYVEGTKSVSIMVEYLTVADVTSALTEQRCYHDAMSVKLALEHMVQIGQVNRGLVSILSQVISD